MYTRLIQGYEAMDPELREASASAASKLRPMMCGSSALPYPVMQQWETITKHHLLERYVCDGNFYSLERHKERKHCWQTSSRIPYCRTQHGGNCMEKGATIPPNKETKLPCCSSLYRGPHISEEMGFLKVGAHKRYLRQCSVASEEQKKDIHNACCRENGFGSFTVGLDQRNNIDAAVKKFFEDFQIMLFHYDSWTSEWDQFEWSKRANHVSVRKQTK
ncbi:uncharacterized protein LOC114266946 isoform X2 [Camellia sinensis]|uniref:uncharacterized protein LOC114266946 isoform X2 n=1 Tax=Camellia sinensis TaxID=4442 RepID=UPI001036854C|nr:uncharacterized protein LOC114266946 isoform X2 [Camellia sinensis]XP_028063738.1 uncharacterized protein LOC114266946 isoform X2 [Camellia sinensis]XP_028063746.1 uncharacterized protein LOC114266946 isoform X2 [Camellia sinensis]